ncbi:autotransporter domain-containing protein, partial [Thioclava sp. BHET1]
MGRHLSPVQRNRVASRLRACVSLIALAAAVPALPALADSFSVPPDSGSQTVSGTDTGTIASGATLGANGDAAIAGDGAATGAGVTITNDGTILGGDERAVDTNKSISGAFTLINRGSIDSAASDGFRIDGDLADGSVRLINSGTITSEGGQALDFDKATDASAVVSISSSGTISSSDNDAVRLGGGTISIDNAGTIATTSSGDRAISFDTDDNFDTLESFTITNEAGGVISGMDDAIKVSANSGSDSTATITIDNAGKITSTDGGQAIDLGDIETSSSTTIIRNTGTISAADNDGIKAANDTTIYNSGTITSDYA